jgi:hypothetical protein
MKTYTQLQLEPTQFFDKNGVKIKAGDLIKISHMFKNRQFRDREKFTRMEDGRITAHYDEGDVVSESLEWVAFRVQWWGSCLVGEREDYSSKGRYTNLRELPISCVVINLDSHFKSESFEVVNEHQQ